MVPGDQPGAMDSPAEQDCSCDWWCQRNWQYAAADISSLNCFHSADFVKNCYPLVPQEAGNYIDMPLDI
jgi:hypothetical protein